MPIVAILSIIAEYGSEGLTLWGALRVSYWGIKALRLLNSKG